MSLVGFKARNHPQQTEARGRDVGTDDRGTVAEVFDPLNAEFGPFTIDVAAAPHNTKCHRYYTAEQDGLAQSWADETVWCNPPYSAIEPWVRKAWHETHRNGCRRVVLLLPANRTEQRWWQDLVEPYRDTEPSAMHVRFLPGRPRFLAPGQTVVGADERPPFGVCVVVINAGDLSWQPCPPPATLWEADA